MDVLLVKHRAFRWFATPGAVLDVTLSDVNVGLDDDADETQRGGRILELCGGYKQAITGGAGKGNGTRGEFGSSRFLRF